ncbi:MAG: serine protease [Patescibacteria group bacterium]|jgi:S1-C subfamily serine protease|nr:serine protease [Patescibacteria group bacterium]
MRRKELKSFFVFILTLFVFFSCSSESEKNLKSKRANKAASVPIVVSWNITQSLEFDLNATDSYTVNIDENQYYVSNLNNRIIQDEIIKGGGSGEVLTSDGFILTCYHVVDDSFGAPDIKVIIRNGRNEKNGFELSARLVTFDEGNDLAVIKVDAYFPEHIVIGSRTEVIETYPVYNWGYPLGDLSIDGVGLAYTQGYIDKEKAYIGGNLSKRNLPRLLVSTRSVPGVSGSPLFSNESHHFLGVTQGIIAEFIFGPIVSGPVNTIIIPVDQVDLFLDQRNIPHSHF